MLNKTSLDALDPLNKARVALTHALQQIRDNPSVGWFLGFGTETFSLLTESFAAIQGEDVAQIRKDYMPVNAKNPREDNEDRLQRLGDHFAAEVQAHKETRRARDKAQDKAARMLEELQRNIREHAANICDWEHRHLELGKKYDEANQHRSDLINAAKARHEELTQLKKEVATLKGEAAVFEKRRADWAVEYEALSQKEHTVFNDLQTLDIFHEKEMREHQKTKEEYATAKEEWAELYNAAQSLVSKFAEEAQIAETERDLWKGKAERADACLNEMEAILTQPTVGGWFSRLLTWKGAR